MTKELLRATMKEVLLELGFNPDKKEWLAKETFASKYGITVNTVRGLEIKGEIEVKRIGRHVFVLDQ